MFNRWTKSQSILMVLIFSLLPGSFLGAQNKSQGLPPAKVSAAAVMAGMMAPQAEFIGTVLYQEVSDVASELSGLVEEVHFEEGQRIKNGQILVALGSDLLRKRLEATVSSYEQVLAELDIARIDYARKEKLFKNKSIAEQAYDESRFRVKGLIKRAASLKAEVERLKIELQKKIIRAPFDGVVIKRHVDRGEWLAEGATVAVLAKDDVVDIVAEVPERFIPFIQTGMEVRAVVTGVEIRGTVFAVVPRGDIATRTFPVKIRTRNTYALIEGMSAKVILPTARPQNCLIVPRDAVISLFGQTVVFVVNESRAKMIPVDVVGYEGLKTGVEAEGLTEGLQVVVKGHERLRDGQFVSIELPK
ncbi:MAG: efflux RND transporter periplasmic adaptor subunit [Desulfobacterales bacterium]|nr:MAG: efflux RND transporter periplasmic adaptor subunit [Desulfobacterales bacterium]